MSLSTVFLVLPLLSSSAPDGLALLIDEHSERPAADSALAILEALPTLGDEEASIARFLLAGSLAELGLGSLAAGIYRSLSTSPWLGGAAFVGWLRVESETGGNERIFQAAKRAPWDDVAEEDFAEATWYVARAGLATERYPEARSWARQVPAESPWYPYACYLLAQSEYALGRYARAIEAAEPVFSRREPEGSIGRLQERTAILLGNMLTEIGLYDSAVALLSWPDPEGPFAERARRDRLLALGLAALAEARFDRAERLTAEAEVRFDALVAEIAESVASDVALDARVNELRREWPAPARAAAARRWSSARAARAAERLRGWTIGRVFDVLWDSFPPVALWRLVRQAPEPSSPPLVLDAGSRFFFAPRGELSRLLVTAALLEEGAGGCRASAVRRRAAAALLDLAPAIDPLALQQAAERCEDDPYEDLDPIVRRRLRQAVAEESGRLRREVRTQRLALDEAMARARLDHQAAIRAAEGTR